MKLKGFQLLNFTDYFQDLLPNTIINGCGPNISISTIRIHLLRNKTFGFNVIIPFNHQIGSSNQNHSKMQSLYRKSTLIKFTRLLPPK